LPQKLRADPPLVALQHIHDLFSTLVVSLTLKTNRQFFKMYPSSFTSFVQHPHLPPAWPNRERTELTRLFVSLLPSDEGITNISSLKFSQSTRSIDPNERSRVRTVTTTTSFSMNKDAARGILQQMLDAKLFVRPLSRPFPWSLQSWREPLSPYLAGERRRYGHVGVQGSMHLGIDAKGTGRVRCSVSFTTPSFFLVAAQADWSNSSSHFLIA
jgi:hypothetical protein